ATPPLWADPAKTQSNLAKAAAFEKDGDWEKACEVYENLLRLNRSKEVKERYRQALGRVAQLRRHRDLSYQREVLSLPMSQALELYGIVRDTLLEHGLDRKKTSAADLFRRGVTELENALADPFFVQQHVASGRVDELDNYRAYLKQMLDGS